MKTRTMKRLRGSSPAAVRARLAFFKTHGERKAIPYVPDDTLPKGDPPYSDGLTWAKRRLLAHTPPTADLESLREVASEPYKDSEEAGVYLLFLNKRLVYIGQSVNVLDRIKSYGGSTIVFDKVRIIRTKSEAHRKNLERALIKHFKPPFNDAWVGRSLQRWEREMLRDLHIRSA